MYNESSASNNYIMLGGKDITIRFPDGSSALPVEILMPEQQQVNSRTINLRPFILDPKTGKISPFVKKEKTHA